jgi:Sec-independent protein translocase protein TatA
MLASLGVQELLIILLVILFLIGAREILKRFCGLEKGMNIFKWAMRKIENKFAQKPPPQQKRPNSEKKSAGSIGKESTNT